MTSATCNELLGTVQQTLTIRSDDQDIRLDRIQASGAQQSARLERIDGRLDEILTLLRGSQ